MLLLYLLRGGVTGTSRGIFVSISFLKGVLQNCSA